MKRGDLIQNSEGLKATVNWAVDYEIGVMFENGESSILDVRDGKWSMLHESTPIYQTSVEHMTDEQLRASIEDLRQRRIMRPEPTRTRVKSAVKAVETPEQKQLKSVLGNKTEAEKLDLMRKLGLID